MTNFEIIKFEEGDIKVDVMISIEKKTAYLTQKDMSILFGKSISTISEKIKGVFSENDRLISEKGQISEKSLGRPIKRYDLKTVLEIGERIKSNRGLLLKDFVDNYFLDYYKNSNKTIIYNNGNINLAVTVSPEEDTVWLTQSQIAVLFEITQSNVSKHIKNIFEEGEIENPVHEKYSYTDSLGKESLLTDHSVHKNFLYTDSVHKESLYTASDGKTYSVDYYNLDVILAVGYRVKSKKAIEFRRWASSVLKQYLLKGYAIDENRVLDYNQNINELNDCVVKLVNKTNSLENRLTKIENTVYEEPFREKLFCGRQYYDAYELMCALVEPANKSVVFVDPYIDKEGLKVLKNVKPEVRKIVCLSPYSSLRDEEKELFEKQYGKIEVYKNDLFHDRYLLIDDIDCYSLGSSLNRLGHRISSVLKLDNIDDIKLIKENATK